MVLPADVKMTPMLVQYREWKEKYPDCILFFRMGDFYEMFFDDAKKASEILDITLTECQGTPAMGMLFDGSRAVRVMSRI
ncbi:MAG TPA: hypothetical protein DIC53_09310, partial [Synergistaceae bacterium]|nr:hypothetical protein [Synergistaceae bacterium]